MQSKSKPAKVWVALAIEDGPMFVYRCWVMQRNEIARCIRDTFRKYGKTGVNAYLSNMEEIGRITVDPKYRATAA